MFKLSWEVSSLLSGVLASFLSLAGHLGISQPSGSCLPWTLTKVIVVEGYLGRRLKRLIWVSQ